MKKYESFLKTLLIGIIASLLSMGIYYIIEIFYGQDLTKPQITLIIGLVVLFILTPIIILIYERIQEKIKNKITPKIIEELKPKIKNDFDEQLQALTGIVEIFQNYPACDGEIVEHLQVSKNIKLFLQIGKTVLSGTTSIYDYIAEAKLEEGTCVKILHTNTSNPNLSENIATIRNSNYDEWVADTEHAKKKTAIIKSNFDKKKNITFESKIHNEGYIWRFFIFDDYVYVQPYLYKSNNSEQAPVYKISKYFTSSKNKSINKNSLYFVFSKLFDSKWNEN